VGDAVVEIGSRECGRDIVRAGPGCLDKTEDRPSRDAAGLEHYCIPLYASFCSWLVSARETQYSPSRIYGKEASGYTGQSEPFQTYRSRQTPRPPNYILILLHILSALGIVVTNIVVLLADGACSARGQSFRHAKPKVEQLWRQPAV
jgi:hypothetical protein